MYRANKIRIVFSAEHTRAGCKILPADANFYFLVNARILNPVRCVVLRNGVEAALVLSKPNLDLALPTSFTSARGEIKVLLSSEIGNLGRDLTALSA